MALLQDGHKVPARFAAKFTTTDQDVKDISTAAKPETRWCLLELPADDLAALEKGSTYYFQAQDSGAGAGGDIAALCTDSKTYSLEFLENSNSLLIAQSAATEVTEGAEAGAPGVCEVFAQVRGQMFTKPARVNTQLVQRLLAKQVVGEAPPSGGGDGPLPVLNRESLEYEVAASPAELQAMLESGPYVEVDGVWRTLPQKLEQEIVDATSNLIAARGWAAHNVDMEALFPEVQAHLGAASVPTPAVLRKALRGVLAGGAAAASGGAAEGSSQDKPAKDTPPDAAEATQKDSSAAATQQDSSAAATQQDSSLPGAASLALDREKMSLFQALQLLTAPPAQTRERFGLPAPEPRPKRARHAGRAPAATGMDAPLLLQEFAVAMQELTGAAEPPSDDDVWKLLGSEAYLDEFEGTLHALDAAGLPREPRQRLTRLFQLQSHWEPGRMARLIAPVLPAGQKVDTWLMKQVRAVHVEIVEGKEQRMYIKKFGTS